MQIKAAIGIEFKICKKNNKSICLKKIFSLMKIFNKHAPSVKDKFGKLHSLM